MSRLRLLRLVGLSFLSTLCSALRDYIEQAAETVNVLSTLKTKARTEARA
ncbi:MAG: hypothetical protein ABSD77_04555 [Verrucomicrobiota bacterium]